MTTDRRTFVASLAALAAGASFAQDAWPGKTIRIVTPTPPGVGSDAFARFYAERLGKVLNVPVVVENRPGALGTIGTDAVAKAAPDGNTVLFSVSNPFTYAPALMPRVPYNPQVDLVPVTQALRGGSFVVANPSAPFKTLRELVDAAKAKPKSISYASYGPGSTSHVGMELLQDAAGIELLHVPYKQGALTDVMGGQVAIGFEPAVSALPHLRSGKLRALGYTGDRRSTAMPDVPTLAEQFPGVEVISWIGFWVPAKTPQPVVARLHKEITTLTQSPEMQKLVSDAGLEPASTTPEQTAAIVKRDADVLGRLIRAKGIRLE